MCGRSLWWRANAAPWPPNGLELSCPAEAGGLLTIVAHDGGQGALPYAPARRVSFSELLGVRPRRSQGGARGPLAD